MYETLGTGPEGESSDSDSDGEDWDDERMQQLDTNLAAHFKMASAASRKQQAKLDFQARRDFKMRVIDLIETYIKRQASSPLIVELVVPFLVAIRDATAEAQVGSKPLVQRLTGVFSNRLCKLKQHAKPDELDAAVCHTIIKDCFELIKTETQPKIGELASQGASLVVKMLMGSTPNEQGGAPAVRGTGVLDVDLLKQLYSDSFAEYMSKKNKNLRPAVFIQFTKRFPELGWHVAPEFTKGITSGTNPFLRAQAMMTIQELFHKPAAASVLSKKALDAALVAIAAALGGQFERCATSAAADVKTKFVKQTLTFGMHFARFTKKLDAAHVAAKYTGELAKLLESPLAGKSPQLKSSMIQLTRVFDVQGAGKKGNGDKGAAAPKGKKKGNKPQATASKASPAPAKPSGADANTPTAKRRKKGKKKGKGAAAAAE